MRSFLPAIVLLFLMALPVAVSAQKKEPTNNVKAQMKNGKEDPWADYQEEKDSISRWMLGINIGGYFPGKYSANFYNGIPTNVNTVNYVMSNKYWYQDIKQLLKAADTVVINGYPTNMHYHIAITAGVYMRYNLSARSGIFIEANYVKLKADDVVTMEVDPMSYLTFPDIRLIPVTGWEERAILDVNYQRSFPTKSHIYYFLSGGITMCYTHVLKNSIIVEGREFSMINIYGQNGYVPNSNSQSYNITQYGIGFGPNLGGGIGLPVTDKFLIEAGASMQYHPTNLEKYPEFRPNFGLWLRILWGFSSSKTA